MIPKAKRQMAGRRNRVRLRLSLRTLLLCVTVAGVIFGFIGRSVQRRKLRAQRHAVMQEQYTVSNDIFARACTDSWLRSHNTNSDAYWSSGTGGGFSGPPRWDTGQVRWFCLPRGKQELGISIQVEGGLKELEVGEITVHDHQGLYNRYVIEELTQAYAKKKWVYRIVNENDATDPAAKDVPR